MENEMQIINLEPEVLVKNERGLNAFIQKAEILRKSLDDLGEVLTDETYETAKKLRQEITSGKTAVEDARSTIKAPVLELGRQIDSRAKFLSEPFEKMKEEVNAKIYSYEEEDRKRKEAEKQRIDNIINQVKSFNELAKLVEYYKTLEPNDQKKKDILESFTLRKNQIVEEGRKKDIESIKQNFLACKTLEELRVVVVGEYGNDPEIEQAYRDRKDRIEFEIEQEKQRIEREKLDKERKEREEKEKEDREKLEEEKRKILQDKIEIAVGKIGLFLTVEALDSFYNNDLQEEVKNADIVKSDYNSKRKSLLQALEIEKKAQEEKMQLKPEVEVRIDEGLKTGDVHVNIEKAQETSSVHYVLQRGFETPNTELQLEACIEAIKRTYGIYDNKTEFVTYLKDFILSYNEE